MVAHEIPPMLADGSTAAPTGSGTLMAIHLPANQVSISGTG
ncbi:MAG TPA: hypothetical protein VKD72_29435 [Gemmataceae bacterium]|nr:hypothetical protein [Gemmataceae bacterium]